MMEIFAEAGENESGVVGVCTCKKMQHNTAQMTQYRFLSARRYIYKLKISNYNNALDIKTLYFLVFKSTKYFLIF